MERIIWFITMIPCSALFTGIGIYAWNRKKPMWFWSGSTVEEREIRDIPAYNRANGGMWIVFSLPLWLATFLGRWSGIAALILLTLEFVIGLPVLILVYNRIYARFKA